MTKETFFNSASSFPRLATCEVLSPQATNSCVSLFSSFFLSMPSRPSTENFTTSACISSTEKTHDLQQHALRPEHGTLSLGVLIRTLPLLAAHKQWPSGSHSSQRVSMTKRWKQRNKRDPTFNGDSTKPSLRRRYLEVLPSLHTPLRRPLPADFRKQGLTIAGQDSHSVFTSHLIMARDLPTNQRETRQ